MSNMINKRKSNSVPYLNSDIDNDLVNMRIIQRTLVYVISIPLKYAEEHILAKAEFFGQFGTIKKIVINKRTSSSENTASAYITYSTEEEAISCIKEVDESILDGKMLRCTYGTTKYCSFFLGEIACQNNECMYLHEYKPEKDTISKDSMSASRHKLHSFAINNRCKERIGKKQNFEFFNELFKFKSDKVYRPPEKISFEPSDI